MIVQMVAYKRYIPIARQDDLNCRLFNESKADIILFPGWTFRHVSQLENFQRNIINLKSFAVMELKKLESRKITNCLFTVQKGKMRFSSLQLFATSNQITGNAALGNMFLDQFENQRRFITKGRSLRVIQCGELNILRNEQSNNNRVKFRFHENKMMNSKFVSLLNSTDIILNPQHTPMGNQGKLSRRRNYLSSNGRAYFSTTNAIHNGFDKKSLQYAYYNGKPLLTDKIDQGKYHALFQCNPPI